MSFLYSSVDPKKIALTVKSLAVFVPSALVCLKYFHVDLGADTLNNLVDALANLVLVVGTVVSGLAVVFGAVRKAYHGLGTK